MAGSTSLGGALESGVSSIAIFLLLNVIGAGLAQAGVLPRTALAAGSRITALVLLPALIFSKMGATFNVDMLLESWVLLPCACLYMSIGALVGRGIAGVLVPKANVQLRICFVMACSFNNASALPLVLAETLCKQDLFGADCFDKASTYIFLWGLAWHLVFWSIGYHTLQRGAALAAATTTSGGVVPGGAGADGESAASSESTRSDAALRQGGAADPAASGGIVHRTAAPGDAVQAADSIGTSAASPAAGTRRGGWRATLKGLANPNLCSVLCAITVSLIPPLQGALFNDDGALRWFGSAAQILGEGAVPMVTLIIAGTLGHSLPGLWKQLRACCAGGDGLRPLGSSTDGDAPLAHKHLGSGSAGSSADGTDAVGAKGDVAATCAVGTAATPTDAAEVGDAAAVAADEVAVTVTPLEADTSVATPDADAVAGAPGGGASECKLAERDADPAAPAVAVVTCGADATATGDGPPQLAATDQCGAGDVSQRGDVAPQLSGSGARVGGGAGSSSGAMVAPPTTLASLVLTRMVLVPGLCMLVAAALVSWILDSDADPTLALVVVLQCATPSANLLVVVSTHVGFTRGAEFLAASYILQYLVGIISMTVGASLAVSMASQLG